MISQLVGAYVPKNKIDRIAKRQDKQDNKYVYKCKNWRFKDSYHSLLFFFKLLASTDRPTILFILPLAILSILLFLQKFVQ